MLLVFGSINLDLVFVSPRHPQAGETVLGAEFSTAPGGKGANQAVAAARDAAGLAVVMVGAVGRDAFAAPALEQLRQQNVDLSTIRHVDAATGIACISVEESGENRIIVASGANEALLADHVDDELLSRSSVVLMQNEIATEQNRLLAHRAKRMGKRVVLNAAPALPLILHEWAGLLDVLIVNEGELAAMSTKAGVETGARHLAVDLSTQVIVTLGAEGVLAISPDGTMHRAPALPITPVDTTGAGDTFCGVFSACLARHVPLEQALQRAGAAASLACLKLGAQTAIPSTPDIDAALRLR